MILQNMVQAKLAHWQCHLYGQHKALDSFFEEIIDLGDNLAETVMGKYGKPTLDQENLKLELQNYENAKNGDLSWFMDHLVKCYTSDCRTFFDKDKDSEIVNIIDEILALVNKTKYLVSLK
jgi:DNA-binding ferritin-like protein